MFGVVIVTWNSEEVIGTCLDACLGIEGVSVIVVDNASTDNTVAAVRRRSHVRLIKNAVNRGFAGGVNDGMSALQAEAVLLLNPDAMPLHGVEKLCEAVLMPGVGAVAGRLEDPTGKPQDGFNVRTFPDPWVLTFEALGINRLFPRNPVNTRYRVKVVGTDVQEVDQPAGAFLMVNRHAWQKVGGFDESFRPAWFEDVDFCLRLRQNGYRILYHPGASARHIGGHSATRMDWGRRQVCWYESLLRYAARHFRPAQRRLVAAAVMLACAPRGVLAALVGNGAEAVRVYWKVFRLAWSCWRKTGLFSNSQSGPSLPKGETGTAVLR